jgi:hypothetical protein
LFRNAILLMAAGKSFQAVKWGASQGPAKVA